MLVKIKKQAHQSSQKNPKYVYGLEMLDTLFKTLKMFIYLLRVNVISIEIFIYFNFWFCFCPN